MYPEAFVMHYFHISCIEVLIIYTTDALFLCPFAVTCSVFVFVCFFSQDFHDNLLFLCSECSENI